MAGGGPESVNCEAKWWEWIVSRNGTLMVTSRSLTEIEFDHDAGVCSRIDPCQFSLPGITQSKPIYPINQKYGPNIFYPPKTSPIKH